jgi:hypothetical protein
MLFNWLKPKRNPEIDVYAFKDAMAKALGERLKTFVVFGSLARGEYYARHSNVNTLLIVQMSIEALERLGPALKAWLKKGYSAPVLVESDGLDEFAQDFPIEFLDMIDEHRILHGDNPFLSLQVDAKHLKAQCEHDLALVQLRLRQAIAVAQGSRELLLKALIGSLPSTITLFRATVRLEENSAKLDKIKAVDLLALKAGFDPVVIRRVQEYKLQRKSDNLNDLAIHYLDVIGAVLTYLRKP